MQTTIDKNNIQARIIVKIPTTRTSKVESEAVPDCSGTTSILSEVSIETSSENNVCPTSSTETVSSKLMMNKAKKQTYSSADDG